MLLFFWRRIMKLDLDALPVIPSDEVQKANKQKYFAYPEKVSHEIFLSMKDQAEFLLTKSRINLLLAFPFFGCLATGLKPIPTLSIATIGTDGYNLWYNPIFVVGIAVKYPEDGQSYINFIMCHEILHCTNEHIGKRRMGHRDMIVKDQHGNPITLWNIAADYIVNATVENDVKELDNRNNRTKLSSIIKRPAMALFDTKYDGMITEEVYDLLLSQSEKNNGEISLDEGSMLDDHSKSHEDSSKYEQEKKSDYWRSKTQQALIQQKMKGDLPQGLQRINDNVFGDPTVDWKEELMQYVVSCNGDDYRMIPPNKRHRRIMLPSHHSEMVTFTFAYDTSGSMDEDSIKIGVRENKGAAEAFEQCQFRLISCDADVHGDITLDIHSGDFEEHLDDIFKNISGGGGTDFRPVFNLLNDEEEPTRVLIFFTDGYGDFPVEAPDYDVIWVRRPNDLAPEEFPFGRVITINEDGSAIVSRP